MRAATRLAVLALWIALVAMLVRESWRGREPHGVPVVPPAGAPAAPAAEESWMGVYLGGRKIGYTRSSFRPIDGGYRFEEHSVLRLKVLETPQVVRANIAGETDEGYALRRFQATIRSGPGTMRALGEVRGRELLLRITLGGQTTEQRVALSEPIYLPVGVHRRIGAGHLEVGEERTVRVFDPMSLGHRSLTVRVEDREQRQLEGAVVPVWRVVEEMAGMKTVVWLDPQGREVEERGPMGIVARREDARRAATEGWSDGDAVELMAAVAVPVRRELPDARELARLDVRVGGVDGFALPEDDRQSVEGGILRVRTEAVPASAFPLPWSGEPEVGGLEPSVFVQSGDPAIRRLAARIAPPGTDAVRAAVEIRRWVYGHLEKVPVASVPNALEALREGRGDCNEHAVLYAALARAAGLPARIVAGAVYTAGVFLYHAWNEVWLGDRWVSVDATFDQMPADATHLKLVEGGPERHVELLQVIGRLSLDVVASGR